MVTVTPAHLNTFCIAISCYVSVNRVKNWLLQCQAKKKIIVDIFKQNLDLKQAIQRGNFFLGFHSNFESPVVYTIQKVHQNMQVVRAVRCSWRCTGQHFFFNIWVSKYRDGSFCSQGPAGTETIRINLHQIRQNIVFNGQESVETSQYLSDRSC